uniref:MACPF domain-containing protein n=1 Tax=Branchiostoma floridae TaxID=7739 RepID=C3ZA36_BRAFL|eukprot:XP_002594613.1 hypothetical protein BRAFLDRAFT_77582 [Branchiostoma floridae]
MAVLPVGREQFPPLWHQLRRMSVRRSFNMSLWKVVSALGDRIAEGVVENHQEKVVSALEDYFSGQFDKADEEFDNVIGRSGNLLAAAQDVEQTGPTTDGLFCFGSIQARVQVLHGRGSNTGDTFSPPSQEVRMTFEHREYKDFHVPDQMTVQGVYDTDLELYTFSGVEEYRHYLEDKSAVTSAKGMFQQEMNKVQGHGGGGGLFGFVASAGGGQSKQTGSDSQTSNTQSNSLAGAQLTETSTETYISMLELNVFRYEIFLDSVRPQDLELGILRDFLTLPTSYFSIGADRAFQNFILRHGTHYITSAKLGGQLKMIKTKTATAEVSKESFAQAAQSDFKKVFSTFSAKQTMTKSSSWFHDHETKNEKQTSSGQETQDTASQSSNENQENM